MSIHQMLQNFSTTYRSSGLRFIFMLLGVILLPFIFFVNGGADSSAQNSANLAWEFLGLGVLFLAALSIGLAMFKRKALSLSISTPIAARSAAVKGGI
jgi:hypothetical protein